MPFAGAVETSSPALPGNVGLPGVDALSREAWADAEPRFWRLRAAEGFHRITVHHAGAGNRERQTDQVVHRLRGILHGHRNRNYGDIGYHFVVDRTGRLWEGRSLAYQGAHVCAHNRGNVGVMLLGNFEDQHPSREQVDTLRSLLAALRRRYAMTAGAVYGHRDLGASVCPGRHLYAWVNRMKQKV